MLQCYFLLLQVSQSQVGCSSVVCVCFHLTWGPGWRCNLYLGHAGLMAGAKKWCQCYTKTLKTCAWNLRKWLLVTWPWSKQVSQTSLCYQGGRCNPPPGRGTWKNSAICPEHRWVHTLQTFLQPSFFMEAHVFGHSPHLPPQKRPKSIRSLLTEDRKMDWSSLMLRTFSYNQQPGADQTRIPIPPEGQSLLEPICPCYQGQFEHSLV